MSDNTLQIGKEYPPDGEGEAIEKLRALHLQVHAGQPTGPAQRGQHPKQHAGLWATFRVEKEIPTEMRAGIFAEPRNYTALVRFSNGGSIDDTKPAVHAMAVKVLVPRGGSLPEQQDFILADCPVFFARNVQHMLEFVDGRVRGTLNPANYPKLAGFSSVATKSLLDTTYWSQTPYKFGDGAVKYSALPLDDDEDKLSLPLGTSPDFLREDLTERLTHRKIGGQFEFCVNPQTNANMMPIEDPSVEWTSTRVRLATVSIYPQKFDMPEQMSFFENLSWSPWNALPEHTPIGGINRARKFIYQDSSALRHKTTGMAPVNPTGQESF